MASLNTLRTKGGVIVTIVIFLALLAFLIGDIFTSGSSIFNQRKMRVGEINGKNIGYVDFLKESDYVGNIYKMMWGRDAFSSEEQEGIYNIAWEQFVMQYSIAPGLEKAGFVVSGAEQLDMVDGVYISPVVMAAFVNPGTGMFDPQLMKMFMSSVNTGDGSYALWQFLRNQMAQERIMSKYRALVAGGFYANALEVAHGVKVGNESYSGKVVGKDYYSVPDSLVNISDAQVKKYYNDHKDAFKQGASRDIEYVVFDVIPSEEDYNEAREVIFGIADEFAASDAPMQYATLNSQDKVDTRYYRADQLSPEIAAIAFGNDRSEMYGPKISGNVYSVSRVADVRMMPDTVGAMHILLPRSERALADSLVGVIRGGADFETLAMEYSADRSVAQNGGDLGKFAPELLSEEFADAAIAANVGDVYVVESNAGVQVVKLTYKSRPVQKAQIATVKYPVDPSAATIQKSYQEASAFLTAAAGSADGFRQAVNDMGLSKRTVRIKSTDRNISGLDDSKEMVRWAFNGKKGDVSTIMGIGGDYFVAALTDVREEGYASVEQVKAQIVQTLRNEEKARMIAAEMTGNSIAEVAAAIDGQAKEINDIQWSAFYIPEFGVEPQLIGALSAVEAGVLSKPVEGVSGVYRFVVTDVKDAGTVTEESEKVRLETNALNYVAERTMQALTEESDIKDMRVKFF